MAINVSGIVRNASDNPITGSTRTIALSIAGDTPIEVESNSGDGTFSFSSIAANAGDAVTLFIKDEGEKSNLVSSTDGSTAITLADLRDGRIQIRSDDGSNPTNITDMEAFDNSDDSTNMLFNASLGSPDALTVEAGHTVIIESGFTFKPDGDTTIGSNSVESDLEIAGTWEETGSETLDLARTILDGTGGTFTAATGLVKCSGSSSLSTWIGNNLNFYNFELDIDSIRSLTISGTLILSNDLVLTSGNLDNGAGGIEVQGDCTVAAAVGGNNNTTHELNIKFNGTGAQTLTVTAGGVLPSVEIDKASGVLTVNGSDIKINKNFILTSSKTTIDMTTNSMNLEFKGGVCIFTGNNIDLFNMEVNHINGGSKRLTTNGTINVVNDLVLVNNNMKQGTLGDVRVSGDITVSATFGNITTDNDALITLVGSATKTITISTGAILPKIELDKTNSTDVVTVSGGTFRTFEDLILTQGTIRFDSIDININMDIIKGSGVSTFEFIGTGNITPTDLGSSPAFDEFKINKTSGTLTLSSGFPCDIFNSTAGQTIIFDASSTYTINQTLILLGNKGSLITFTSSFSGSQFIFTLTGGASQDVDYVDVKDCDSSLGDQIVNSPGGVDSGNVDNWDFGPIIMAVVSVL